MKEPRTIAGVPRMEVPGKRVGRKAVPSLLGGGGGRGMGTGEFI